MAKAPADAELRAEAATIVCASSSIRPHEDGPAACAKADVRRGRLGGEEWAGRATGSAGRVMTMGATLGATCSTAISARDLPASRAASMKSRASTRRGRPRHRAKYRNVEERRWRPPPRARQSPGHGVCVRIYGQVRSGGKGIRRRSAPTHHERVEPPAGGGCEKPERAPIPHADGDSRRRDARGTSVPPPPISMDRTSRPVVVRSERMRGRGSCEPVLDEDPPSNGVAGDPPTDGRRGDGGAASEMGERDDRKAAPSSDGLGEGRRSLSAGSPRGARTVAQGVHHHHCRDDDEDDPLHHRTSLCATAWKQEPAEAGARNNLGLNHDGAGPE